jgi:tetratricopeptide (TPR) repeat protein
MALQSSNAVRVSEAEDQAARALEVSVHQNLAICFLKLERNQEALKQCQLALQLDGTSWKAHLRRGEAFMAMKNLDESRSSLSAALKHASSNKEQAVVHNQIVKLQQLFKAHRVEEKEAYGQMFAPKKVG